MDDKVVELARIYSTLQPKDVQGRKVIRRLIDENRPEAISNKVQETIEELKSRVSRLELRSGFQSRDEI